MRRVFFVGIAALAVISTVAEAADGCGRGMYYNGAFEPEGVKWVLLASSSSVLA
jgi:hypothetical protein